LLGSVISPVSAALEAGNIVIKNPAISKVRQCNEVKIM
jgi:hypothetical protein